MNELFYYEKARQQAGPVAANQLVAHGVTASTLVWSENMVDWAAAGTVPALRDLFASPQPVPTRPAAPANAQPAKPSRPRMRAPAPARSASIIKTLALVMGLVLLLVFVVDAVSNVKLDTTEQQDDAPAQEEEVKEIGYGDKHIPDEDIPDDTEEAVLEKSTAREPAQEDAIESVDNDNHWLTVRYASGKTKMLSVEKDWFFAYSPHLIVFHNDRVSCLVEDIYGNRITSGTTLNDGTCTGLRVVGDHIIIDVDTGHNTHQETYDKKLSLLRRSNIQMY